MNRAERDSFAATTDQDELAYGESACLETPPDLFQALTAEFQFQVDLTANEQNHTCPVWFGPGGKFPDVRIANWCTLNVRSGFSNPPYGAFVPQVLERAIYWRDYGFTSVFLLPMRASKWYTGMVLPHADEVRHIDRVKFWYQGKPKLTLNTKTQKMEHMQALFDSIVVIFRPIIVRRHGPIGAAGCPHVWYWKWQQASPA